MDEVKGMQARRVLRAGQPFRGEDVRRPIVVTKGQTVTMQFAAPGVELTAMGRAMSEGGVGDTVTVQNPASYRMISAIVIAPGTVRATGPIAAPTNNLARRIGIRHASAVLKFSHCRLLAGAAVPAARRWTASRISARPPKLAPVGNPAGTADRGRHSRARADHP